MGSCADMVQMAKVKKGRWNARLYLYHGQYVTLEQAASWLGLTPSALRLRMRARSADLETVIDDWHDKRLRDISEDFEE